jgi:hypothetical protein
MRGRDSNSRTPLGVSDFQVLSWFHLHGDDLKTGRFLVVQCIEIARKWDRGQFALIDVLARMSGKIGDGRGVAGKKMGTQIAWRL